LPSTDVTLDILFGGPLTGARMNPARTFTRLWSPISGPLCLLDRPHRRAILAGLVYNTFFLKPQATT
jgi:hypothetical protein